MHPYEHLHITYGHDELFGRRVGLKELIEYLSLHPVSQWLELCAKLEGFLLVERKDVADVHLYLSGNLFPQSTRSRIARKNDENVVLFSLGQLNLLRKMAVIYGRDDGDEREVPIPKTILSKVLLACHDFHNDYDEKLVRTGDLESFCQFVIRNGYLNFGLDAADLFVRARQMYILQDKQFRTFKNFSEFFKVNVGITIEQAMAFSFALASPFFQEKERLISESTIIDPRTYFENLELERDHIEAIIDSLVADLPQLKTEFMKELGSSEISEIPLGYNLDFFRKKPLIRLGSGRIVCGSLPCLLQKTTQNTIWLPKSRISGLSKVETDVLVNDLTNYRGLVFEEYIKKLFTEMETKNPKQKFFYISPAETANREEVGDSILIDGDRLVVLEAKSRQFNESFKYTGEWSKDKQFIEELVKEAARQIQTATRKILGGEVVIAGIECKSIKRIYPVIVTYEPVPMHGKVQRYIREKIQELNLLSDPIFAPMEILCIDNLEKLMDGINSYTLIDILEQKHSRDIHASESNFNNFYSHFASINQITSNGWGRKEWDQFFHEVFLPNLKFKPEAK